MKTSPLFTNALQKRDCHITRIKGCVRKFGKIPELLKTQKLLKILHKVITGKDLENHFVCFLSKKGSFQAQKNDFKIKSLANFFSDPS
jgi:hypothetical protein